MISIFAWLGSMGEHYKDTNKFTLAWTSKVLSWFFSARYKLFFSFSFGRLTDIIA